MNKILVVGQAPPLAKQFIPYDTTMLYDWFSEIGISRAKAYEMFDFDAVCDTFPGLTKSGGHKPPTVKMMNEHWERRLRDIVLSYSKIILLGKSAQKYIGSKNIIKQRGISTLNLLHPSKRNYYAFSLDKDSILKSLKDFCHE